MSLLTDALRLDTVGTPRALLIQLTEPRDGDMHAGVLNALSARKDLPGFALATLSVTDWNADLSLWPAPPVYGSEGFSGAAGATLEALLSVLPALTARFPGLPVCLGGYSLAGLFALWTFYHCDAFDAVNAASPSVWFPGWDAFADASRPSGRAAYLSLGKKEPRTRNRAMASVGDAIQRQEARFRAQGVPCALEWNEGNHFAEPDLRTARGFAWVMAQIIES